MAIEEDEEAEKEKLTRMSWSPSATQETETPTSKPFTYLTDNSTFNIHHYYVYPTTVHLIRPPESQSSSRPWIITRQLIKNNYTFILLHPLTSKPHSFNFHDDNLDFSQLHSSTLAASFAFESLYPVDKLLVLPTPPTSESVRAFEYTLLALYGGGELRCCLPFTRAEYRRGTCPWVKLLNDSCVKFDDIVGFQDKVYAVDRQGITKLVVNFCRLGKTIALQPLTPGSGWLRWRKRFAIDGGTLYLVVRTAEELFNVFMLKSRAKRQENDFYWDRVTGFGGNKVLFMARDYCFFRKASRKFPGREYKNCIVFSEAAFPQYGNDCWEFTKSGGGRQLSEDDIAVFRLDDERFALEEEWENSGFPKIDWSPPAWIFDVSSFPADEFMKHSESESCSNSERDPDEDEGLDSELRNLKIKEEEQDEMHSKEANIKGDASLKKDPVPPSRSDVKQEVTRTLPRTTKFEGLDIRSDLVPTLQKIWRKHGNIIKDSIVRSGEIVARLLESLATMVRILEDNLAQSLSDSQADYLSSTLSDLRSIGFNVYWLVSFVEKALKLHKSKSFVESLNNLGQLSSQVKERRAILLDEVAKLDEEENKLKAEMLNVFKMIPFSGQVNFDKPVGAGLP